MKAVTPKNNRTPPSSLKLSFLNMPYIKIIINNKYKKYSLPISHDKIMNDSFEMYPTLKRYFKVILVIYR